MAETGSVPDAWVGQEVHVRYAGAGESRLLNCTMQEANDRGVTVVVGEKASFFPWSSIIRIDLGRGPEPQLSLRVRR
jgi:hypothetical protein